VAQGFEVAAASRTDLSKLRADAVNPSGLWTQHAASAAIARKVGAARTAGGGFWVCLIGARPRL